MKLIISGFLIFSLILPGLSQGAETKKVPDTNGSETFSSKTGAAIVR